VQIGAMHHMKVQRDPGQVVQIDIHRPVRSKRSRSA
jgi:hypothetical protein